MAEPYPKVAQLKSVEAFRARLQELALDLPVDDQILTAQQASPLAAPIQIGGFTVGNRWCVQPMEGWDASRDGSPSPHTLRRWRNFGLSGGKLIWGSGFDMAWGVLCVIAGPLKQIGVSWRLGVVLFLGLAAVCIGAYVAGDRTWAPIWSDRAVPGRDHRRPIELGPAVAMLAAGVESGTMGQTTPWTASSTRTSSGGIAHETEKHDRYGGSCIDRRADGDGFRWQWSRLL